MTFPSAVSGRGAFAAFQAVSAVLLVLVELYLNPCMGQGGWTCCVAAPGAGAVLGFAVPGAGPDCCRIQWHWQSLQALAGFPARTAQAQPV